MIVKNEKLKIEKYALKNVVLTFVCVFFCSLLGFSQEAPKVTATIDTTQIRIGEQINYNILIEVDSTSLVIFPEEQTFSPLEMVEALKIDTSRYKNRFTLQRKYALTQFDSGTYTIPPQRIAIDEKAFFTDSIRVTVGNVPVDTLKQKMFDIKPLIDVGKNNSANWVLIGGIIVGLLLLAGLLYWFILRKNL